MADIRDADTVRRDDTEIDRQQSCWDIPQSIVDRRVGHWKLSDSLPDGAAFIIIGPDLPVDETGNGGIRSTTVSSNWTLTQIAKAQELLETIDEAYRQQRTRKVFDRFWNKNIKPVLTSLRDDVESPETK